MATACRLHGSDRCFQRYAGGPQPRPAGGRGTAIAGCALLIGTLGFVALGTARLSTAADPATDASGKSASNLPLQMARLFDLGRKATPEAREKLPDLYRELHAQYPDDFRVQYGYALALLRQRRPDEAVDQLTETAAERPRDFALRRATICAMLAQAKPGEVLGEMTSLAAQLASPAAGLPQEAGPDRVVAATFLGQVVGYLDGPRPGVVEPDDLERFAEKIRWESGSAERAAFAAGRKQVAEQFKALQLEQRDLQSAAKIKEIQHRDRNLRKVAQSTEELSVQRQALDAKEKKLNDDAVELDQINLRLAVLHERSKLLDDRAAVVQAARDIEMVNYQALPPPGSRLEQRGRYLACAATIADLDRQIAELNAAAREMLAAAQVLEGRRQALQLEGALQVPKLAKQEAGLTREQKKTQALERKSRQTRAVGSTPQVQTVGAELSRLQSYIEFALEAEQQRLLSSLQPPGKARP